MMTMILFSLIAIAIVVYISCPLIRKSTSAPAESGLDEEGIELLAEQESLNAALADLDFEYESGKVSDEDYQKLRQELLKNVEAISARIESASITSGSETQQKQQVEDDIEAEIARYKKQKKRR